MTPERNRTALSIALIAALAAAAFWSALDNGFTSWDDPRYVTENPLITAISWENVKGVLATFYKDDYRLLTVILSFMAEYRVAGLDPFVYHLDNVLLNVANSVLVFVLIYLLSRNVLVSLVTGLLFAVHPTHAEAVAWISERKGVLSAFFFLSSIIFYILYRERSEAASVQGGDGGAEKPGGTKALYILSVVVFLLSLLSKLVAVSLPVALLCVDYLQGRRIDRRFVVDKIPFVVLAAVFALDTLYMYEATDQLTSMEEISPAGIALLVCKNLATYLYNMVWPVNLSAIYPFPEEISIARPVFMLSVAVVAVVAGAVAYSARYTRKVVFGVLFFLVTMLPVLQVVPFASGGSAIADRYLYIPSIGLFYIAAVGFHRAWSAWSGPAARAAMAVVLAAAVLSLAVLSYQRGDVWQTSESLYLDTIEKHPGAVMAHFNLGNTYMEQGRAEEAARHFREAVRLYPADFGNHYNLGLAYSRLGRYEAAAESFRAAARLAPGHGDAHYNLGNALARIGRFDAAVEAYSSALEVDPARTDVLNNLGIVYVRKGDMARAVDAFRAALRIEPGNTQARENLDRALGAAGSGGAAQTP